MSSTFYKERNPATISANTFNFVLGLCLAYGFAFNWYLVETVPTEALLSINGWVLLIGYFASCLLGIFLSVSSSNPVVSFIGYNLVVIPFGLLLNIFLADKAPELVSNALMVTTIVTCVMMFAATIFPSFFLGLGNLLFISLLIAIVVQLLLVFVFKTELGIMDWIVAIIFCGYIGYDWSKAMESEKTIDNAVDGAVGLYMSIVNLFVKCVSILDE